MSNGSSPQQQPAETTIDRATALGKAIYTVLSGYGGDDYKASTEALAGIAHVLTQTTASKETVSASYALLNGLLTDFFAGLGDIRKGLGASIGSTTAEVLNEFLGTEFDASVITPTGGGDETLQRARGVGQALLRRLEQEFSGYTGTDAGPGQTAASTFAGYGVNFGIQNALISIIGSLVPIVHLDDLRELGVEVAQNLGLGRLVRQAMRPLVQATIATPYTQELNARYQNALLGIAELAKAWHAERLPQNDTMDRMRKHGLSDAQITELLAQTTQRLNAIEWNSLTALGKQGDDPAAYDDQANGMDDDWIALRQTHLSWLRLQPLRDRVLSELIPQIKLGFVPIQTLQGLMTRLGLPADEQALWREAAGNYQEVPRKRPSQAEMLYLYEAAQITDDEVQAWLAVEGFSAADQQLMLTYFRLKMIAASGSKSSAHAAALHKEHIAFVTDEISGLFSRPPTAAELNYWVPLLDSGQRTKHDFTTELKALPTTGSAIPA